MSRRYFYHIALILLPWSAFGQSNYISADPFLPLFGTVQVHYERAIWKKMSFELGLGRKFSSGIFELSGINTGSIFLEDLNFEGIKILPEVRYYLSSADKGINGFYTGMYFKYQTNHSKLNGTYTDKDGGISDINLNMDIYSKTLGIEIGYKLKIYKNIFCDMLIAGVGLSEHKLTLSEAAALSTTVKDDFYDKLNLAAKYYSPLKDFNPDVSLASGTHTVHFPSIHLRYGFKFGIAF